MYVIIQKLIYKKSRIITTLCPVEFKHGGYSFPIPVRFNPDNDVFNIFENSRFITKSLLQHGRYWSLHEILCDIYEKDPKTTWLSDEPLINLPLWDVGTSDDHVTNYAPYMYSSFFQTFSANVISTWDDDAMDAYAEKFCHRVNNRVCTKIYVSPDEQSLQQRVGELVRKEDVQRDIFLSGFYAFLDQFMTNLAKEVRILKDNDLIPYYSNVWKNLLSTLRNIVSQLKSTFTEEQGEQFSQVLQSGIDSWRRIWFDTNKIPNKIKLFLENYTINQANLSEVITLEIIQSYKVLKLYDDGMTSNMESSITPLQCYQFIEYQHKKYLLPYRLQVQYESIPAKRRKFNRDRVEANENS